MIAQMACVISCRAVVVAFHHCVVCDLMRGHKMGWAEPSLRLRIRAQWPVLIHNMELLTSGCCPFSSHCFFVIFILRLMALSLKITERMSKWNTRIFFHSWGCWVILWVPYPPLKLMYSEFGQRYQCSVVSLWAFQCLFHWRYLSFQFKS